jgi:RNA polymerase sigma factor (sigma-70 family)
MTEAELLEGCIAQKRASQKLLYEKYKTAMFTLAYRLSGDFAEAEDILQEAFMEVFTGIKSFKQQSTLGAWIKTIVSRKAISKYRKKVVFEDLDSLANEREIVWETNYDGELLQKAMLLLPEGFRTVIVLYELEGYKHHEIGEMLGIAEGTSKSQLYHGKKKLKELILKLDGKQG